MKWVSQIVSAARGRRAPRERRDVRRLDALWRILGTLEADDERFITVLLGEASASLRAGTPFFGFLEHVDGHTVVLDAVSDGVIGTDVPAPGHRVSLEDSLAREVLRRGTTLSWADLRTDPRLSASPRIAERAWRAAIATPLRGAANRRAILGFIATAPLDEPFSPEDHAYVETLAAVCAARVRHRAALRYHLETDPLTELPNRASFRAAAVAALEHGPIAVAVLDVDRFREFNDTRGHEAGDALLAGVGARLAAARSAGDTIARLGGDSFGIVLRGAGDRDEASRRLARYEAALTAPVRIAALGEAVEVSASIGLALAPEHGTTVEQLLTRADVAVYAAKEAGRGRRAFFEPQVEAAFARAYRMRRDLADALANGEFTLHFQPHIELRTGRVAGAEALIRWEHPERGLISPAEFIPFAEGHGLAPEIGAWVMRETMQVSAPWRHADRSFRVWFNISAAELDDPGLIRRLNALDDVEGMGVEITETAAMRDVDQTRRSIASFRQAGLRIALDDFGTGYSSLAHLKRLAVDVVKVDRAFTAGIPEDADNVAIVEAVVSLAAHYGFETVAEGVENLAQVAFLSALGCTYGQGYAYARPMPAPLFADWIAARSRIGA